MSELNKSFHGHTSLKRPDKIVIKVYRWQFITVNFQGLSTIIFSLSPVLIFKTSTCHGKRAEGHLIVGMRTMSGLTLQYAMLYRYN